MTNSPCCTVNCTRAARWEVDREYPGPDTGTLACDEHLAEMARDFDAEHIVIRRLVAAVAEGAEDRGQTDECPTCGSNDPAICMKGHTEPHSHPRYDDDGWCCPNSWHGAEDRGQTHAQTEENNR